ncbi:MAG: HEAT repeat domain-containing protein, partial [Limisphaerales bacterium]
DILSTGYGVRVGFLGHDLHGLRFGPDGRLYFSIGDRGANVTTKEGRRLETPDTGAVFRCDPDGSNLEIYATGLRNPQELAFDEFGNLFTGDNNSDGGDQARWTYLVEGGDSGWHIGWQFLESPNARGPWNSEGMWKPSEAPKVAHLVPPLANIGAGPSGVTYNPGTGLPAEYDRHFFMVDFRGGPSGIWSLSVKEKGAGFEVVDPQQMIWEALPTDVEAGPDGGLYWSDWVQGWDKTGKGRIYRAYEPAATRTPAAIEARRLLREGFAHRSAKELAALLGHADQRVRQGAQFALADAKAADALLEASRSAKSRLARLHGLWGLGQLARQDATLLPDVAGLLGDAEAEVRAQAARVLGDARHVAAAPALRKLLGDPSPRPRFFAAIALGRIGDRAATDGLLALLRANANADPFLRHAGVMGLAGCSDEARLRALAMDDSVAVRLAAVVALRRLKSPAVGDFLDDADPAVVTDAARAINDTSLEAAMPRLAAILGRPGLPEAAVRRAINANLRAGGADHAAALAQFAKLSSAETRHRAEAVTLLGNWPSPSGRDEVTGLWRPLPARDAAAAEEARTALSAAFNDLLAGPAEVQVAAAEAAGRVGLVSAATPLAALARDTAADAKVRTAALRALAALNAPQLGDLVAAAVKDDSEAVRREGLRLQGGVAGRDALAPLRAALENGAIGEQQAAFESLAKLPGEGAEKLLLAWIGLLREGRVPAAIQLDLIEAAGQRGEALQKALGEWEASLPDGDLARRQFLLAGGDAAAGRKVFHEKEALACLRCHKVGDPGGELGGDVGPNLASIGATRTREQILTAIIHPNQDIAAGFENLLIKLKDGTLVAGLVKSETDTELVVNSPEDGPMTLKKADIESRERGLSGMPEGLEPQMTKREFRDLIEYLAQQKAAPQAAVR